jgi:alanine racemase
MRRVEEIATAGRDSAPTVRPTRAEIDLEAVLHNAREVQRVVGNQVGLLAVVKADAYGHGAVPVARALADRGGVRALAVSLVEEGLELRRAGVRGEILVMGGVYGGAHRELLAHDLVPIVSDGADLEPFARAAAALGRRARMHLKVDTGMSRLGLRTEGLAAFLDALSGHPELEVVGLCTHFATADAADGSQTRSQLARFEEARRLFDSRGIQPVLLHAANTAATFHHPEARFDAVRPGLALYGGGGGGTPADGEAAAALRPTIRFVSAVAQLRDIAAGDTVSYGAHWRAPVASRIATLPVGYADGYPRRLSVGAGEHAEILVGGRRCPVVGAVCMDMTLVDVTALGDDVRVGDEAVLLGAQGDERITTTELAERAGLIEYEITCGISKRVPRVYR